MRSGLCRLPDSTRSRFFQYGLFYFSSIRVALLDRQQSHKLLSVAVKVVCGRKDFGSVKLLDDIMLGSKCGSY